MCFCVRVSQLCKSQMSKNVRFFGGLLDPQIKCGAVVTGPVLCVIWNNTKMLL